MSHDRKPLYGRREAGCLQVRELAWSDDIRHTLLTEHTPVCRRLIDIGCGWGQLLGRLRGKAEELWGLDESPDRARDLRRTAPEARFVIGKAQALPFCDSSFETALTAQIMHEVLLFGSEPEYRMALHEIRRILAPGGRFLFLDHQDAGDGEAIVRLPPRELPRLQKFEQRFRFYPAVHEPLHDGSIRMSRRCLQDFLTKTWSLDSGMEALEMNETHNVFIKEPTRSLMTSARFRVLDWIDFMDIRDDIERHGGSLVEGQPWSRKFLLVAERI